VTRDRLLIDLAQVERHIERGEDHIARQRKIVAALNAKDRFGYALDAHKLLEKFKSLQDQHLQHRYRLLDELARELRANKVA